MMYLYKDPVAIPGKISTRMADRKMHFPTTSPILLGHTDGGKI